MITKDDLAISPSRADSIPVTERRRRVSIKVPNEGDGGLFSESWFPIALSDEVPAGALVGKDFLDGRVVIYRGEDGVVRGQSAYCAHLGADLSVGAVVGNNIRCAFHRWEYGPDGMCARTADNTWPPPRAALYTFPVQERFGIIWIYNGPEPRFDLFDFEYPDEELLFEPFVGAPYPCDPWVLSCNTPDFQHVAVVHQVKFKEGVLESFKWDDWGFLYNFDAVHQNDVPIKWEAGIRGTSTFIQQGLVDGWWLGVSAGYSLPRPGCFEPFVSIGVRNVEIEAGKTIRERIDFGKDLLKRTVDEDTAVLNTIHFKAGYFTRSDEALTKFLKFLAKYPRSHPSRDFIR